jgi:hypothetical protein
MTGLPRPWPARRSLWDFSRSRTALLLGLAVFGFFALTAGGLVGYDPETAAASEGLVRTGQLRILPQTPLGSAGLIGRDGLHYARTGLTQPLLEAPFYWLGEKLDELSSDGRAYRWRTTVLQLFEPAMASLSIVAFFGLMLLRGVAERRALLVAGLCAVATMIWPYSKIRMDTTLMTTLVYTVLAAAWTARRPTAGRLVVTGLAAALTINSKGYGLLLLIGLAPLMVSPARQLIRQGRVWRLLWLALPICCGLAAAAWYNWYRTGSVTNFDDSFVTQRLLAMPFSAAGLLVSPGKGLVFYSPLVVLGILGLRECWRADRALARTIVLTVAINVVFIATSIAWSDETWGPRYLLPSAWLLILPIAWWTTTARRRRWVLAVAVVGCVVQFVGVFVSYAPTLKASRALTGGEPVYLYGDWTGHVAYGDDGPRWVPQASMLLFQGEVTAAYLKEKLTGTGFIVTYKPWRGNEARIDLRDPDRSYAPLPDFWWATAGETTAQKMAAGLLAILCLGSVLLIAPRLYRRGGTGPFLLGTGPP